MPLYTERQYCEGRRCCNCGKCRDHGTRAGARGGAAAGVLSIGALAGVSVFLVAVLGPFGITGIVIATASAGLCTAGGAAVGAGLGAVCGAIGGELCKAGICKCRKIRRKMS